MYANKKVLVAGGTGTIGIPLVKKLLSMDANVTIVSLDSELFAFKIFGEKINFIKSDLTSLNNCLMVTKNQDMVFNLVGIKGSTGIGETKVASYLVPMLWFQTNLMEASFRNGVEKFLFVSSICGYPYSSEPKKEVTMWDGLPRQNDKIPGLAKRIGEIQGEAYLKEYGWDAVKIVRPSNVYGPFDDFNPISGQVIPSLINRCLKGENPLVVWGDGSAIRDFVFSNDVADWILKAMEIAPSCEPLNLGNGKGVSIKELVETIVDCFDLEIEINWDKTKPTGDPVRILSMEKTHSILGHLPCTTLRDGITSTIEWYKNNLELLVEKGDRYYGR